MYTLYNNDCYEQLKLMPDNSIDSIVTDPPYGISFMNKKWDYELPSVEIFKECLRVLKHGGHILVACGTRTQHRMAVNIEDAGFEIRDIISWIYSQGFPKSLDIGKKIDEIQENEREVIGNSRAGSKERNGYKGDMAIMPFKSKTIDIQKTKGNSIGEGQGTNLKPAMELWTLARKPILENSIAENVLRWGTGGINIDDSKIETSTLDIEKIEKRIKTYSNLQSIGGDGIYSGGNKYDRSEYSAKQGRYPANVIHDGSDEVLENFPYTKSGDFSNKGSSSNTIQPSGWNTGNRSEKEYKGDEGSASRFFYCAKVSPSERNIGFDKSSKRQNNHPTLKPLSLMKYLVRLITPKNGVVLDPFMGSGTTGMACIIEGFNFVGIEREKEYFDIANTRIDYVNKNKEEFLNTDKKKNKFVKKEKSIENKKDNLTIF